MSALSDGWVEITLDQVSIKGVQRKPGNDEPIIYIDIGSIDRQQKKISTPQSLVGRDAPSRARKVVEANDILVSLTRPNLNAVALVSKKFHGQFVSTGFEVIRPFGVESRFVFALVRYTKFINAISGVVQGALYPAAKSTDVRNFKFLLPPLNEQIRIANKLDGLLAKVETAQTRLEKIPVLLKRFRQSVLAAATSGELTREWRGIPEFLQITEKYNAPIDWKLIKLVSLCSMITSGSRGWAKFYAESGATFIRAQNINSDRLNLDDIAYVHLPDQVEGKRTSVGRSDLLVTITGANVTKAAMVKIDLEEAYVSQHVALIKLNEQKLAPFLELFIQAENSGRGQLKELAYGAGKPGLNLQNIKDLDIAIPPLEEQAEIVRRVESLFTLADKVETQYQAAKTRLDKLTQSILAKAFRGELVPQDPNDEPASELLKRIQTEREQQAKTKPKRGRKKAAK